MSEEKIEEKTTLKSPWYYMKDASGEKSVTVTILYVAFVVTTIAYALSWCETITTAKFTMKCRPFDVGAATSYWVPIISLYFGRKATEAWTNKNVELPTKIN